MRALLILSVAFVVGAAGAEAAETFTFTTKGAPIFRIAGAGPAGRPVLAQHSSNEVEIVWASGKKTKSKGDCIGWSAPPTSGFTGQALCSGTEDDGSTTFAVIGCIANDKGTANDCWGRVTYTSGKNKGRVSTVSSHGVQNADGKGGTSTGSGVMY
jgi:hypothetical protein